MLIQPPPTEFCRKNWISVVASVLLGFLSVFCLVLGPLFLFNVIRSADGRPTTGAGIALCIMSVPISLCFALNVSQLLASRRPLVRLCREGIEFNRIGATSLDNIPLLPGMVRVAWAIISMQGFREQIVRAPWEGYQQLSISGPSSMKVRAVIASVYKVDDYRVQQPIANVITYGEVAFNVPLEHVAHAIYAYGTHPEARERLPSWDQRT